MKLIHLILPLFLLACAPVETNPDFATPVCSSEQECNAMWNVAKGWILHNVGQAIVEDTGTMMRTDMDQSPGNYFSARIYKEPLGDGRWEIVAQLYCARKVGCDPSPWEETRRFNRAVNKAWIQIN